METIQQDAIKNNESAVFASRETDAQKDLTTLQYAQYYLSLGFSVIPIKANGKTPALASWKEFQSRRPTEEEIVKWFSNGAKYNIGIVTGKYRGWLLLTLIAVTLLGLLFQITFCPPHQ